MVRWLYHTDVERIWTPEFRLQIAIMDQKDPELAASRVGQILEACRAEDGRLKVEPWGGFGGAMRVAFSVDAVVEQLPRRRGAGGAQVRRAGIRHRQRACASPCPGLGGGVRPPGPVD